MGNKKLTRPLCVLLLVMVVITLIGIIVPNIQKPSPKSRLPELSKPAKSIVVRVTPVGDEPGAYVLEYDNGYVEVVHADGTREQLMIKIESLLEEIDELQPLRPNSTSGERAGSSRSPH